MTYGGVSRAWPGLMQSISIFITPTSCAYDILDLPRHAKSPLSLHCCLLLKFSLVFCLCHSNIFYLSGSPSSSTTPWARRLRYLEPCVDSVSSSISPSAGLRSEQICRGQCEEAVALPHPPKVILLVHKNGSVNIFMYQGSHRATI